MKITFANLGNYTLAFKKLLENLGAEVILPEKTNPKTIEEGAKLSPELFCLPLKVNVGNYLSAIRKGADTILMWENIGGSCRLRYYWLVQQKILNEQGFNVQVWNLNYQNFFPTFKKIAKENQIPLWHIFSAAYFFLKELSFIEKLEKQVNYFRPREAEKGQTEKVFNKLLEKLEKIKTKKELGLLKKEAKNLFSEIKLDKDKEVLKVGLVGEIYTLIDGAVNLGIEKKLGEIGVEVERKLNLIEFLKGTLPFKEKIIQKKTSYYLKSQVGGHGQEAVAEMLDLAKEGFDGVIQLLPFGCLPEVTVRPILQEISQEKKIPFLSISIDEQTAEAGIQTRLEAFVDLLWSCKKINHLTA